MPKTRKGKEETETNVSGSKAKSGRIVKKNLFKVMEGQLPSNSSRSPKLNKTIEKGKTLSKRAEMAKTPTKRKVLLKNHLDGNNNAKPLEQDSKKKKKEAECF